MSPKSRGRPKGRGRAKPRSGAVRQLTVVDHILRDLRLAPPQSRLEAQEAASQWLGAVWSSRAMSDRTPESDLVTELVQEASRGGRPTASLALYCLATIPGEWVTRVEQALADPPVASPVPAWARRPVPTEPELPTHVHLWSDAWGASRMYLLHYVEPQPHALVVQVTTPGGVMLTTILLVDDIDPDQPPEGHTLVGDVDPDEALAAIAGALWQTDLYWPPNDDPDFAALRALLHWRTSGRRVERDWQPLPDAERRQLLDDFAAAHGEVLGLDPGIVEVLADTFVDFGEGYLSDGVLAWNPGEVERFLLDWVHRKVLLDEEAMAALPDVLREWVAFALRRRGLPEDAVAPVVEAVDELRDEFVEETGEGGGPASEILARVLAAGIDLDDKDAVAAEVSAYNAELLARRLHEES